MTFDLKRRVSSLSPFIAELRALLDVSTTQGHCKIRIRMARSPIPIKYWKEQRSHGPQVLHFRAQLALHHPSVRAVSMISWRWTGLADEVYAIFCPTILRNTHTSTGIPNKISYGHYSCRPKRAHSYHRQRCAFLSQRLRSLRRLCRR